MSDLEPYTVTRMSKQTRGRVSDSLPACASRATALVSEGEDGVGEREPERATRGKDDDEVREMASISKAHVHQRNKMSESRDVGQTMI